jgi:hypothetical protein
MGAPVFVMAGRVPRLSMPLALTPHQRRLDITSGLTTFIGVPAA